MSRQLVFALRRLLLTIPMLFVMSVVMLGAMHAVQFNHLRHHKLCMAEGDAEAASARLRGWQAIAIGPWFPVLLRPT